MTHLACVANGEEPRYIMSNAADPSPAETYQLLLRERQARFRATSPIINEAARRPDDPMGQRHGHLLTLGYEDQNLFPPLRGPGGAVEFFAARDIKWWRAQTTGDTIGINRPTRNLASSQVACVNFLLPLASVPGALETVVHCLDSQAESVVPLEYRGLRSAIEFEWIGLEGSLEETANPRRGYGVTSADALMVAVTQRRRRGYLFEWKLGESYKAGLYKGDGSRGQDRRRRYTPLYQAADSSFNGAIRLEDWLYDPLYQLLRLRLLADRMVRRREFGVEEVRLVVVCPMENTAYLGRVTSSGMWKRLPEAQTLAEVMQATLRNPLSFAITSPADLIAAICRAQLGPTLDPWLAYHRDRYSW
jgi:hypothetical protein